jgi:opacity protein-like surface antigen
VPRAAVAAATLSLLLSVHPALADDGGLYVGANLGYTVSTYHHADLDRALVDLFNGAGYTAALSGSSVHNEHAPWSVKVGYQVSPYFGLEASYIELGTLKYATSGIATSAFGSAQLAVNLNIKSSGPAVALVGALPMTNHWDFEARLGAYEGKTKTESTVTIDTSTSSAIDTRTSTSLMAGIGAAYVADPRWILRLDYTRLNQLGEKALSKSFNVDLLTAGVSYAF